MSNLKHFFSGFKKGMQYLRQEIILIINSILLSIVYILGIGVTSIFAKLFRKRFLDTKISRERETYWSNLDLEKEPVDNYYRQF